MRFIFCIATVLLFLPSSIHSALPSSSITEPSKTPIKVGLITTPPFVWVEQTPLSQNFEGFAFQLWQAIAEKNQWACDYIILSENIEDGLKRLENQDVDILIGPISVTMDRLKKVAFSRPYFITRVGIVATKKSLSFWDALHLFASNFWNSVVIGFCILFFLFANINWFVQRHHHDRLNTHYWRSVGISLWICFDKLVRLERLFTPTSLLQRLFMGLWLLYSLTVVSGFFGVITSSLTAAMRGYEKMDISHVSELKDLTLGALNGSKNIQLAQTYGKEVKIFPDINSGLEAVQNKLVDGLVCDTPEATYGLNQNPHLSLHISPLSLAYEEMAFALLRQNEDFLERLDLTLTQLQESETSRHICQNYLREDALMCML